MSAATAEATRERPRTAPPPDLKEAGRFLDLLDPEADAFAFQVFDDSEAGCPELARVHHGTLKECACELTDAQQAGVGVFVTINETDGRGRKGENVTRIRAVFADLDGSPLYPVRACALEPHLIVESSPGKYHAYWLVDGLPLDAFKGVQRAIAARFNGDKGVNDLSRVMRLPGFWHLKAAPFQTRIIHVSEELPYSAARILAAFPPITRPNGAGGGATGDAEALAELVRQVRAGEKYHDALRSLAWRYIGSGMAPRQVVETLRGLMLAVPETDRDMRWQARFNEIPRAVNSAQTKQAGTQRATAGENERGFNGFGYRDGVHVGKAGGPGAAAGDGGPPDTIRIVAGELHTMTAAAAVVLGAATRSNPFTGFYRRGSLLVRTARLADDAELYKVQRRRGALVIENADPDGLQLTLTAATRWEKYEARSEAWVPRDAPATVARALLATAAQWDAIPILTGIVEAPTLRPDGTVLDRPGYDPETGLLFDPGGVEFPPVVKNPSRAEAEAALAKLREIIQAFPFVDEASEAVAVSGLITPLVRKASRAVPLHAFSAPKMGSGKTLLATLASYVATGRAPAMMSQADDSTDERKRLLAVLIEGHGTVVIDNIERELKSDALCSILTEPRFSDRLLGASKTVSVPSAATFFATGNNLTLAGDLTARAIVCTLDPDCERPEEREFEVNLHEAVPRHRAELAAAALTIVRAYLAAGAPKQDVPNFARFEDWCRFVRHPLIWLGMADPCEGRKRIEARDPVRVQLGGLLAAWRAAFGQNATTVAQAVEEATREPYVGEPDASRETRKALHAALVEVAGQRGAISARPVGKFLSKHERRIEGGLCFEKAGEAQRAVLWRVRGKPGPATGGGSAASEFGEFREFASGPSREVSGGEGGDSFNREPGPNSPNSPNSPSGTAVDTAPGRCALCGFPDGPGDPLLPYGDADTGHAWLHRGCCASLRENGLGIADLIARAAVQEIDGDAPLF